jgi:uncharacterized lipoprotein YajG
MAQSNLLFICASVFLAGCATSNDQVLTVNNPTSPNAPEAITPAAKTVLGQDDATRRTRALVAARAKEDSNGAENQSPDVSETGQMPGAKH